MLRFIAVRRSHKWRKRLGYGQYAVCLMGSVMANFNLYIDDHCRPSPVLGYSFGPSVAVNFQLSTNRPFGET